MMRGTKLAELKRLWARGERKAAIKYAARFPRLGEAEVAVRRASAALLSPSIYQAIGYDVEQLVGIACLKLQKQYRLHD